jgi:hypothetical protein
MELLNDFRIKPAILYANHLMMQVLEWLVNKPQRDVLLNLRQHLSILAPGGGSDRVGKLARVTPHTIDKQVAMFRGHTEAIYQCSGLLQVTVVCCCNVIELYVVECLF